MRLLAYQWPRHVKIVTVVTTVLGAFLLMVLAVVITNEGPMCGAVQMHAADECASSDGSVASYSDVANSPMPSVLFAIAVGLIGWLVMHIRNNRKPTTFEIDKFERYVRTRRQELRTIYDTTPACQETWATQDELIALFDRQAERARKHKGFSASQ